MKKYLQKILLLGITAGLLALFFAGSHPSRAQSPNFLHTNGNQILDANGNQVILTGISWFGLETDNYAPHGLWARNWESILDQILALGFNTIRLPYSNQLLDPSSVPNSINYELNPDLKGLTGLEIMDKLLEGARQRGLKVILDRHRPDSHAQSTLWYTSEFSEERWIQDWVTLVRRYAQNDAVIGVDLHNEPHDQATWGSGDSATDWRLAAERAGNAILAVNPHLLIIVQGIEQYQGDWYWWGGNLTGVRDYPVRLDVPNQLVYSTHEYGPGVYPQPWFSDPSFPDNLTGIWDRHWGYVSQEGIAPVLLGEFGGRSVGDDKEGVWQRNLVSYIRENNISYSYWTINPDSGDTGGLLLNDWQSIDKAKQALLSGYQFPLIGIEQQGPQATQPSSQTTEVPTLQPTPAPTESNAPVTTSLQLLYRTANTAADTTDSKPEFIIANRGDSPLLLDRLELFYWFRETSDQPFVFHCDWAKIGCTNVLGDFHTNGSKGRYLRLHFSSPAGTLPPHQDTGEIKIRFNRADWSPFRQDSHYSYALMTDYTSWENVTLYVDGKLIWGTEPGDKALSAGEPAATRVEPNATLAASPPPLAAAPLEPTESTPVPEAVTALIPTTPPTGSLPARASFVGFVLAGMLVGIGLSLFTLLIVRLSVSSARRNRDKDRR
jgi:endoglucanase